MAQIEPVRHEMASLLRFAFNRDMDEPSGQVLAANPLNVNGDQRSGVLDACSQRRPLPCLLRSSPDVNRSLEIPPKLLHTWGPQFRFFVPFV